MTPKEMALLHAKAFSGVSRSWSEAEFERLVSSAHVFSCGDNRAFCLGRVVADEAEILTIATDPDQRRQGLARMVLSAFDRQAHGRGASHVFLEVAADNIAAVSLYLSEGYKQVARREGYYQREDGIAAGALILEKILT